MRAAEFDRIVEQERRDELNEVLAKARDSLPPWRDWATFSKLEAHPAIAPTIRDVARSWDRATGSLVLLGPTGVGKSASAHAIARSLLANGFASALALMPGTSWRDAPEAVIAASMRWYSASKLALARKQTKLGDGEPADVRDAVKASVLFLDELGYEPIVGDGTIFDVLNARYEAGRPTIVTSGRTEAELVERYGASFMRRLREPGHVVSVHPRGSK